LERDRSIMRMRNVGSGYFLVLDTFLVVDEMKS
jgi:hypothetical protein